MGVDWMPGSEELSAVCWRVSARTALGLWMAALCELFDVDVQSHLAYVAPLVALAPEQWKKYSNIQDIKSVITRIIFGSGEVLVGYLLTSLFLLQLLLPQGMFKLFTLGSSFLSVKVKIQRGERGPDRILWFKSGLLENNCRICMERSQNAKSLSLFFQLQNVITKCKR